jgi:hypothetical protein
MIIVYVAQNKILMNETQIINELLKIIFTDHSDIRKWLYGYNKRFEMSPDEMIKAGRSDEVISYLVWIIEGPN